MLQMRAHVHARLQCLGSNATEHNPQSEPVLPCCPPPRRWTIWNTIFLMFWVQAHSANPARGPYWGAQAGKAPLANMVLCGMAAEAVRTARRPLHAGSRVRGPVNP